MLPKLDSGSIIFHPKTDESKIDGEIRQLALERDVLLFPVDRLDQAVAKLGITIRKIYLKEPYRGLETFEAEHRGIYFGRQADIETLRERLLAREANQTPGILIVAASGAGKSSLVQAGLIPALEEGPLVLQDRPIVWSVWQPRNTGQAYDETALVDSITTYWKKQTDLQGLTASKTLAHLANQLYRLMPKERRWRFLWVIDQMEELFTLGFSDEVVKCFADFLQRLQEIGVWVIGTLRSDFYDRYQQQPALLDVFGVFGVYDLRNLDATALDQIIEAPAKLADLSFETDAAGVSLATQLREDMGGKIDALPLLEFALKILYISRDQQGRMTYRSYRETGGLFGAIGQRAETAFKTLDESARDSLPLLLWKLIAKPAKEDNQKQFAAQTVNINYFPADDPVMRLIEAFTKERLLVRDKDDQNSERVRVAHEAFFSHWARAKTIIDDFMQDKILHDRLKDQVVDWKTDGQLLTAGLLSKAEELLGRLRPLLDTEVVELIEASVQAEQNRKDAELTNLQAELYKQKRRSKRDKNIAITMAILSVGAVGMGYLAYQGEQRAQKNFVSARQTVDEFIIDISSKELADIPGVQELREQFVKKAIGKYIQFIESNPSDPDVQIGYAKAKGTLGEVLGSISSFDQAVKETQEAISSLEKNLEVSPNYWRYKLELANQLDNLARLYWQVERKEEAMPFSMQAIKNLETMLSERPKDTEIIYSLAKAYNTRGNLFREYSNINVSAKNDYDRSAELALLILDAYPDKSKIYRTVSAAYHNQSLINKYENNYSKSLELLDKSDQYEELALKTSTNTHSPDLMIGQAISLGNRALLLKQMNRTEDAQKTFKVAVNIFQEVVDANPKVTRFSWLQASNFKEYASFLSSVGEFEASRKSYETSASILEEITQRADDRPHYGVALVEVLDSLAGFYGGSKGSIPKDDKAWQSAHEKMLNTARQLTKKYPDNAKINFELVQSLARMANFEEQVTKDNELAAKYYKDALTIYSEKVYTGKEASDSSDVANFLGFAESAIQTAKRLNNLDQAKQINELAYKIGKTHNTMSGIQSLGATFDIYGGMLLKAGQYPQAIEASRKQLELAKPVWEKNDWNWYLRQEVGEAYYHLAELFQKMNNQPEEIQARLDWLKVWGNPMQSIDSKPFLNLNVLSATPDELKKLREATGEKAGGGMQRITIPTDFNGIKYPFYVSITNVLWPNDPLGGQDIWVEKERGGKIPDDVKESFRKLHKIAHEKNVSFVDLTVYALGAAASKDDKNDSSKTDEKTIASIAITVLNKHLNTEPNPAVSTDGIGLAIKGYDPVAYVTEKKAGKGEANYFAVWDKALWFFVSDENRKRFVANPTSYVPVFGGFCTYCMANGHKLHGDPEAWSVHQNKLYFHKDTELRDKWLKDPDSFLKLAHAEWIKNEKIKIYPNSNSAVSTRILEYIEKNKANKMTDINGAAKVSGQDVKPDDNSDPNKEKT